MEATEQPITYKTSTIEIWYPKPRYLIGAIEELKIRAGTLHTIVDSVSSTRWPKHRKRWALIWVRRYSKAEYKIGLQIFNQVT